LCFTLHVQPSLRKYFPMEVCKYTARKKNKQPDNSFWGGKLKTW